jgi:hypothetical protein
MIINQIKGDNKQFIVQKISNIYELPKFEFVNLVGFIGRKNTKINFVILKVND